MSVIVDSNVILDVLVGDKEWCEWSYEMMLKHSVGGMLVINQIVYSEISVRFSIMKELDDVLHRSRVVCENIPLEAAFLAGKCFNRYKKAAKSKGMILPDFYIGAHALVTNRALLTRDSKGYGYYFSGLKLITPETAPLEIVS